jgi:hypothetical protein
LRASAFVSLKSPENSRFIVTCPRNAERIKRRLRITLCFSEHCLTLAGASFDQSKLASLEGHPEEKSTHNEGRRAFCH